MKGAILTAALIGTMSYNVSDAFHITKGSTQNVAGLYQAAAHIDPRADHATRQQQNQRLYAAATKVEPFAKRIAGTADIYSLID